MKDSIDLVIALWGVLDSYTPQKQKGQAAEQFVTVLEEFGFDIVDLDELQGISRYVDKAINEIYDVQEETDDE